MNASTLTHPSRPSGSAEAWARRRWLTFILAIFVAQAALWVVALWLVSDDPSHAIVSDYDERALRWDEHLRKRQASAALGWSADLAVDADAGTERPLLVTLTDAEGQPISDAEVELTLFHQARAAERTTVSAASVGEGRYVATVPMARPGKWRIELVARRGEAELVLGQTHVVQPEG